MPASRLESLPQELRERIYFYLGFPIAGKCIHNCAHQACRPDVDSSIPRHPRAKPHYVDIWDEWVRCGGAGLKMLDVRSVDVRSGRVEGVDVLLYPAVCTRWLLGFLGEEGVGWVWIEADVSCRLVIRLRWVIRGFCRQAGFFIMICSRA
jgi:hypothetical protein